MLRLAVERMLPRNQLRVDRMRKLRIFEGPQHPGFDQVELVPFEMPARRIRNKFGLPTDVELPEVRAPRSSTMVSCKV